VLVIVVITLCATIANFVLQQLDRRHIATPARWALLGGVVTAVLHAPPAMLMPSTTLWLLFAALVTAVLRRWIAVPVPAPGDDAAGP
jgi:hypothetical protein